MSGKPAQPQRPYLKPCGTLMIPMMGEPKHHSWKKGGRAVYKAGEALKGAAPVEKRGRRSTGPVRLHLESDR